jgi:hypothetical protein
MTLSQAEKQLLQLLGTHYNNEDWCLALKVVIDTKGDIIMAQEVIQKISVTCEWPKLTIKLPAPY